MFYNKSHISDVKSIIKLYKYDNYPSQNISYQIFMGVK